MRYWLCLACCAVGMTLGSRHNSTRIPMIVGAVVFAISWRFIFDKLEDE